jgi:predicted permease
MSAVLQDLRFGLRQLMKGPLFSLVAVVTVALGIGATTLIFSLVNALVLRPLPGVAAPTELIAMAEIQAGGSTGYALSYPHFQDYRRGGEGTVRMAASGFSQLSFATEAEALVFVGNFVTGDYFQVLGVEPALGRFFTPGEEVPGVPEAVVVISHRVWRDHFGRDPGIVGGTVRLNGHVLTVVGVAPPGFQGIERIVASDVWVPIPMYTLLNPGADIDHPTRRTWLAPFGRLEAGVGREGAQAVLDQVGRGIEPRWQDQPIQGVALSSLDGLPGELGTPLRVFLGILFATASLVLIIASVNVAGMLLARGTARRRELGIRLALGAGRRRVVSQLITESTLLFVLGGGGGLLLTLWLVGLTNGLVSTLPFGVGLEVGVDVRVATFAVVAALVVGLLFGLVPALGASGSDVVASLKAGSEGVGGRGSRLRSAFVAGQLALSLLLLVSAGLLARSLQEALAVDPGIDGEGVLVAGLNLGPHGYDDVTGLLLLDELRERLQGHPAVEAAGYAQLVPLGFDEIVRGVEIPGHEPPPGRTTFPIDYNAVDGAYFDIVDLPLVQGRPFGALDRADAPGVVIVNETMARRFWPEGDALGSRVVLGGEPREIVGVARDAKYYRLDEDPRPYLYLPVAQEELGQVTLHVKARPGSLPLLPDLVRGELRGLDPDVPLIGASPLEDRLRMALLPQRMAAILIGAFGGIGLLLAAVGLYGLLAYVVGQRTREIGIRMALGARPEAVVAQVLGHGARLVVIGLAVGLLLAFAGTRLLSGFLLGVSPTDPVTFLAVPLVLVVTGIAAAYLPARRATRVDPVVALRAD